MVKQTTVKLKEGEKIRQILGSYQSVEKALKH